MKSIVFSFLLSTISYISYSQAGIYRSYKDFLEDKVMEEYPEYVKSFHSFGNFTITFLDEERQEVKVKIEAGKYWGYRQENGMQFKFSKGGAPCYIVTRGKLNAYTNFRSHLNEEGNLVFEYGGSYARTFTKGDNGEMIVLSKKKLKKEIKKIGGEEDYELLKETSPHPAELMN